MRNVLCALKPDVVLAHWTYEYARAAITSGFPCVVVAHDSPWRVWRLMREPRMLFRALYATFLVLPKVRNLVVVSPHIEKELKGLHKGNVQLIPNGIVPQSPAPARVCREAKTIVCVTEGNRLKNAPVMEAAYEILKKTHPDWKLRVFMKGVNTAPREEVLRVLREEADVFCSPSLEESFGMVFLEAMACGVPCVGGERSGAVPWVLGDAGIVCDVTNPMKLAECLGRVLEDDGLRIRLSKAARARAESCFNLAQVTASYLNLLQTINRH